MLHISGLERFVHGKCSDDGAYLRMVSRHIRKKKCWLLLLLFTFFYPLFFKKKKKKNMLFFT